MIRAYVSEQFANFSLGIAIISHPNDDLSGAPKILRLAGDDGATFQWEDVEPGVQASPTLTLGHLEARAVLDALHAHYSGVEDARALRRDYNSERDRVDKLTDSLAGIAQALASVDA